MKPPNIFEIPIRVLEEILSKTANSGIFTTDYGVRISWEYNKFQKIRFRIERWTNLDQSPSIN